MTPYISKDALVAELKKKIRTEQGYSSWDAECGYRDCAKDILSFLDTLKAKEMDLNNGEMLFKKVTMFYDYLNTHEQIFLNEKDEESRDFIARIKSMFEYIFNIK